MNQKEMSNISFGAYLSSLMILYAEIRSIAFSNWFHSHCLHLVAEVSKVPISTIDPSTYIGWQSIIPGLT